MSELIFRSGTHTDIYINIIQNIESSSIDSHC